MDLWPNCFGSNACHSIYLESRPIQLSPSVLCLLDCPSSNFQIPTFPVECLLLCGSLLHRYVFPNRKQRNAIVGSVNRRHCVNAYPVLYTKLDRVLSGLSGLVASFTIPHFITLFRISGTVAAFSLLYLIENWYKEKRIGKILQLCGQESLYIYVFHLLLVYGSIANFGMRYYVGSRLDPFSTILIILELWVLSYFTALAWHQIKATNIKTARWVMASTFGVFFLIFLLNPA